jgi:hypothetical protein
VSLPIRPATWPARAATSSSRLSCSEILIHVAPGRIWCVGTLNLAEGTAEMMMSEWARQVWSGGPDEARRQNEGWEAR